MRAPGPAPLTLLRRLHWLRQLVLPVFLGLFLAAGIAHASHIHKPSAAGTLASLHCDLCLQFDRLADTPVVVTQPPAVAPWVRPHLTVIALPDSAPAYPAYRARGPPDA